MTHGKTDAVLNESLHQQAGQQPFQPEHASS
jgi:hypothetical protein